MKVEPRALLAEFVGTLTLIFIGSLSAAVAFEALDGGTGGVVLAGLAHGLVLVALIYGIGAVSGCHINPAVSMALAAIGKFDWRSVPGYIVAQLAGAVVGALLHAAVRAKGATHYGLPLPGADVGAGQALVLEAVLTFFLVSVIIGAAVSGKATKGFHGLAIGLTLAASWLVGGALTGAALNPARSFGPAIVALNFDSIWIYWVGPIVGGLIAAGVGFYLHNLRQESEAG
ncbi:MAG: aquaporin [Chloroflexota bacterium]|nr:aquaporin [Chloroflexota bacterium]